MRVDGILFDKDGTLFDFNATWVDWGVELIHEWARGDEALTEAMAEALGFDLAARRFHPDSVVIAGTAQDVARVLAPVVGMTPHAVEQRLNAAALTVPLSEAVPLAPLLDGLRARGLRLGVATNDGEASARAHLRAVGIDDRFDFIVGADSGHGAKPAPGMVRAFLDACGVAPERAVMVGDSTHDLMAGRAAGVQAVGVLTGLAPREVLAPLADAVLPDIGHLAVWLQTE